MKPFRRRTYRRFSELIEDMRNAAAGREILQRATNRGLVSPAFRERLMLAVTAVNQCRYCSYFHSTLALNSGISSEELAELVNGTLPGGCPEDERVGVLYAQHWAEQNAQPDPSVRDRLVAAYGEEKAAVIDALLRMIRMGNLTGNTFDYLLYRLSFGLLGNN